MKPDAAAAGQGPELVWLVLLPAAVAGIAAWLLLGLPLPGCPFRGTTGLPCLTCGMTTGARALLAGEVATALQSNPLAILLPAALAAFWFYCLGVVAGWWAQVSLVALPPRTTRICRAAVWVVFGAIWIYLLTLAVPT